MKTHIDLFHTTLLMTALALAMPADRLTAQTFQVLYSFTAIDNGFPETNSDGREPGRLVLSSNHLYGTAAVGGSSGFGTVFRVKTDGTGFTMLYSFPGGSDGATPYCTGGLALSGNTLYGTADYNSGGGGPGTIFALGTDGSGFATLYNFTDPSSPDCRCFDGPPTPTCPCINADGGSPSAAPIVSGNTLYGTTQFGGSSGYGTVYAVNTDGSSFATLYNFTGGNDGAKPLAALILSSNTLCGTASGEQTAGNGTVFALNTDGTGFRVVHSFKGTDGADPNGLTLSANTLYGTTYVGGSGGGGTVFAVNTDGTGFRTLHSFTPLTGGSWPNRTNAYGAFPEGELLLSDNTLYGTANQGGIGGGTVFAIKIDGTGFRVLHYFTATSASYTNSDGAWPAVGLILSGNTLYGATDGGGSGGSGTIFSLALPVTPPQLTITADAGNVILTWPTNATGFTLQSTTNLGSQTWTAVAPAPVVVNGQNIMTNPISGTQQFYRLAQ